jgi:hypothetical protein
MKAKTIEVPVRHVRETRPARIVTDALVTTRGRHGGRLLPLLLLDTTDRPDFNVASQGFLVEQTLIGQGIYLARAEGEDDRFVRNPDRPKVIVEVPDTGFRDTWDDIFHKHVAKDYRSKGLSRTESRQAARSVIDEWRKFGSLKMRDVHEMT